MASVRRHVSAAGIVSFYIRVSDGYDSKGTQITRLLTWQPEPGMSDKAAEKEAHRQAVIFENEVRRRGQIFAPSTKFADYATVWLENNKPPQLAPKTYQRYTELLKGINASIGHIKLEKLQSQHLLSFYNNLRENGINPRDSYARSTGLKGHLNKKKITQAQVAHLSGLSESTISAACKQDGHISLRSAEIISNVLSVPANTLFEMHPSEVGLSEKTILHYHHLIGAILSQATRDRLIPYNIADRNYTRAPRTVRKESTFLEDYEVNEVISALTYQPIKWRTAIMLLLYSGMRRGELIGLEWSDIDFSNHVIHVRRSSQFVSGMGIITKETKNSSSVRAITLPGEAFALLEEYRAWWIQLQSGMGDLWHQAIVVKYADNSVSTLTNERLFLKNDGTPMNPDSLTKWTADFVKKYNLPHFSPHALRHTNASLLIANGVNIPTVAKRLGHSSVSTTTKVYSHAIQSADEIAANVLSDAINPIK